MHALHKAARALGSVSVVAPISEQSGAAHSISILQPLRVSDVYLDGQFFGRGVNGAPADCVRLAVKELLDEPPDFMRGIMFGFASNNNGLNKIMVDGEQVVDSDKCLAKPNKTHHVIAQILPDGRLQLFVDDQLALQYKAKSLPTKPRFVGLWTWAKAEFDNVRVYVGG